MKDPLHDSVFECEVVSREEDVAHDDSQSGEDDQSQKAEDVLPNGGAFFGGQRMTNLRKSGFDGSFFKSSEPFIRVRLFFVGEGNPIQLPFVMFNYGVESYREVGNKHVRCEVQSTGW